ncbi:ribulokinase [Spirosoma sp. KCTC 42546]|uniref:ribulokinase n=1 Tax=Spirosoma sp. KCTC 42546 TaxID=2520506 RepID=UPI00115BA5DE|nr:ribulokinase [Spirosoma sp. KCTC 42546]QDK77566.1 ribulokinase [Spirosoma sp. KCTC 42546]
MKKKFVIGLDFGTDSVRGLLLNPENGETVATGISYFNRWKAGLYCNPKKDQYRQHPLDYIESIDEVFSKLFTVESAANVLAIGTNTTGSTPVAVDVKCRPLALSEEFSENPNAMFVLWKDHSASREAGEINALSKKWAVDYTQYSGGIYSSEWFWSKILHINRTDERVFQKAYSWMEQSDWIPAYLCGTDELTAVKRNRCAAGHKAMWHEEFGGLPSAAFLNALDPTFEKLSNRFYTETYTSDQVFGTIAPYFTDKFGFNPDTIVTVGAIDAHHGAVGAGITPYTLVKVIGTSTCDMLVVPASDQLALVEGICGQVDGSIDPGMVGFEAGQSAFGDIFNWFKKLLLEPTRLIIGDQLSTELATKLDDDFFDFVTTEARQLPVTESDLVFTDYHNGRRTPDADFDLHASAYGFSLATQAGHFFKALVEATAFGSRAILERFRAFGVPIEQVIATGGIPNKSPYVVQVLANVMGVNIQVVDSDQTCALGSTIFAATACGIYPSFQAAKKTIAATIVKTYSPDPEKQKTYEILYSRYKKLAYD